MQESPRSTNQERYKHPALRLPVVKHQRMVEFWGCQKLIAQTIKEGELFKFDLASGFQQLVNLTQRSRSQAAIRRLAHHCLDGNGKPELQGARCLVKRIQSNIKLQAV